MNRALCVEYRKLYTDFMEIVFRIIVLIFSVVIHEVSHGFVADKLGDRTARDAGRLTLNPLKHLDPMGSIIVPLILSLLPGGVIFGWAKPVPYNPMNLRDPKRGGALIAFAGPASNILLAIVFALLYRLSISSGVLFYEQFAGLPFLFSAIVLINTMLALFNLVPLPPLDGSKVLFAFLPDRFSHIMEAIEQYSLFLFLLFVFFGFQFLIPLILGTYRILLGL